MASLSPELKAAIAKRSRNKGSNYERDVAKKIAAHFNWKWDNCFIRTSLSSYAQPHGDLRPINEMKNLWEGSGLGPIECKNRAQWSFDQIFKNPAKSELIKYWEKSNEDCGVGNTVLFFTKNGVSDYVMLHYSYVNLTFESRYMVFSHKDQALVILTLKDFLKCMWNYGI